MALLANLIRYSRAHLKRITVLIAVFIAFITCTIHLCQELVLANRIMQLDGWYEWNLLGIGSVELLKIDDTQLAELAPELRNAWCLFSLSLGEQITDDGLKNIENLPGLRWLYVGETQITDRCIPTLQKMKNLEYICLMGGKAKISDEGMQVLLDTLPRLKEIRTGSDPSDFKSRLHFPKKHQVKAEKMAGSS
jgi:hypothetical protein